MSTPTARFSSALQLVRRRRLSRFSKRKLFARPCRQVGRARFLLTAPKAPVASLTRTRACPGMWCSAAATKATIHLKLTFRLQAAAGLCATMPRTHKGSNSSFGRKFVLISHSATRFRVWWQVAASRLLPVRVARCPSAAATTATPSFSLRPLRQTDSPPATAQMPFRKLRLASRSFASRRAKRLHRHRLLRRQPRRRLC